MPDQSVSDPATTSPRGVTTVPVVLIPGDGIGPEITACVRDILEAAGAPIDWQVHPAGLCCTDVHPTGLPDSTMAAIAQHRIALKGPTETPSGSGHKSVNVTIRKGLELYANVRPIRSLPGIPSRYENIDILLVRENVEDTYGGIEHFQTPDVAQGLKIITRPGSTAACLRAFEMARDQGRKRVTCVHKANIHKLTDGLFLECFREVAAQFPEIAADDILVDNLCMQLVKDPTRFDVVVLPNLYGDIVSDLCAGLVGGLGVAPSGNLGDGIAVFEAVHGSAPDIAGKGVANPTALLLAAIQMVRHLGLGETARRIEKALETTLAEGVRTADLGGSATSAAFTANLIENLPATSIPAILPATPAGSVMQRRAEARTPNSGLLETRGLDIFVEHQDLAVLPPVPPEAGGMRLAMISNRGTKVWPGPLPDIRMVNWYRCRYVSDAAVSEADVMAALSAVANVCTWVHIERLRTMDGKAMYSKAQGE
ncbi:MAG: isocitrate/isopropylmalate family dehydrogenase [Candidatus Sericytochromatia bacterium]|nr:isocitrate/isopropylmalate family dehydrogenase [Candidatus Sericytochromatia bacterium]